MENNTKTEEEARKADFFAKVAQNHEILMDGDLLCNGFDCEDCPLDCNPTLGSFPTNASINDYILQQKAKYEASLSPKTLPTTSSKDQLLSISVHDAQLALEWGVMAEQEGGWIDRPSWMRVYLALAPEDRNIHRALPYWVAPEEARLMKTTEKK